MAQIIWYVPILLSTMVVTLFLQNGHSIFVLYFIPSAVLGSWLLRGSWNIGLIGTLAILCGLHLCYMLRFDKLILILGILINARVILISETVWRPVVNNRPLLSWEVLLRLLLIEIGISHLILKWLIIDRLLITLINLAFQHGIVEVFVWKVVLIWLRVFISRVRRLSNARLVIRRLH